MFIDIDIRNNTDTAVFPGEENKNYQKVVPSNKFYHAYD